MLQFAVSLVFLARGWLTWRWDSPIRELIWEENWWSPVLQFFGKDWAHFARTSDAWISPGLDATGVFLVVLAIVPWLAAHRRFAWMRWLLLPGIFVLLLDALSRWLGKDMQTAMALEHFLQIASPVALLIFLGARTGKLSAGRGKTIFWLLLLAAAGTFIGHGLYAVGYYSVPLNFRNMSTEILPLSEAGSVLFLKIAGWLDFAAVVLLLIPASRRVALAYMVFWGGLTTLARLLAYFSPDLPVYGLDPWIAEALVRTPHWLVPLLLLCWTWRFSGKNAKPASRRPRW